MWPAQATVLRPLGVGERMDAAIKIVRANFLTLARASLVVAIPAGIVVAIISASVRSSEDSAVNAGVNRSLYTALGGELLTLVITLVVGAFVTAVCFRVIANAYLGQRADWREALHFGWSRLPAVIWISVLTYVAVVIGGVMTAVLIVIMVAIHLAVLTVLFSVVLGVGGLVAMVWFLVSARLAVPVLMLENKRGTKAIRRALTLCRGHWWSVFGTQFLAGLLVSIASAVVGLVLGAIFAAFHGGTPLAVVDGFFVQTISYVVFAPFSAAILVVLTIDLRVRKEGFDIQLLSTRMGLPTTASALYFTKPPPGPYGPVGYPRQGYPPPGYPPPGYSQQPGYPPPGYSQQPGYPPPGYPQQAYPPQSGPWYPPAVYPVPPPTAPPSTGYPPPAPPPGWPRPSDAPPPPTGYPPTGLPPGWPRPSPPQPPPPPPSLSSPPPSESEPARWPSQSPATGDEQAADPSAPASPVDPVDPPEPPAPDAPRSE